MKQRFGSEKLTEAGMACKTDNVLDTSLKNISRFIAERSYLVWQQYAMYGPMIDLNMKDRF